MNNNMKRNSTSKFLKVCSFILVVACVVTLSLLYHGQITSKKKAAKQDAKQITSKQQAVKQDVVQLQKKQYLKLNLQRPVNHYVSGLNNSTRPFTYVIFSDPQVGLYDIMKGSDGTHWLYDINNIRKFSLAINALKIKPDFVFCTGDLNNAYPLKEPGFVQPGFQPRYRPQQTKDLMQALHKYLNNDIPFFTIAGNHDLSEITKMKYVNLYEKTWGQSYFYFWNAGRVFIALETQFFRSREAETVNLQNKEMEWLKKLFNSLHKDSPKTVFQHVPLFIKDVNEIDSQRAGNALSKTHRHLLLQLFCKNNVNIVFSGHTHYASLPKPYKCINNVGKEVRQIVLTSITAQLRRNGMPSYTVAKVNSAGNTTIEVFKLDEK